MNDLAGVQGSMVKDAATMKNGKSSIMPISQQPRAMQRK